MNPYETCLLQCIHDDERVVIMTAENRGHMRELPYHIADRFIDVGIAEQTMIGAAAGMAKRGCTVVTHALAAFLTLRPLEFIRDDVGIPAYPVIMVGMVPGVLSDGNGPTHQAIDDIHHMRGIPNINVFCPADITELVDGMHCIVRRREPWYVRYHATPRAVEHSQPFTVGQAVTMYGAEHGDVDATLLTYGYMTTHVIDAASILASQGYRIRVVNMRTLQPYDAAAILHAVNTSTLLVTVEDHLRIGGLYSIVAETLLAARRTADVLPIDLGDTWFPAGRLNEVLDIMGLHADGIVERIQHHLHVSV
jgi:transketolase